MRPLANQVCEEIVAALEGAVLATQPWAHAYLTEALTPPTAHRIESAMATVPLRPVQGEDTAGKSYRMATERLRPSNVGFYPAPINTLYSALNDMRYRVAMQRLTGANLTGADLTVDLWRYSDGDWLAPHIDKAEKLVTQLFYFTAGWRSSAGGHLFILTNRDDQHPFRRLVPRTGSGAVLVRSPNSWHAVEAGADAGVTRCSVAATFWATEQKG